MVLLWVRIQGILYLRAKEKMMKLPDRPYGSVDHTSYTNL